MPRFITNLWFGTDAHEAAEYYCSVFPNSKITRVAHYTEGRPMGEPIIVSTMIAPPLDDQAASTATSMRIPASQ